MTNTTPAHWEPTPDLGAEQWHGDTYASVTALDHAWQWHVERADGSTVGGGTARTRAGALAGADEHLALA